MQIGIVYAVLIIFHFHNFCSPYSKVYAWFWVWIYPLATVSFNSSEASVDTFGKWYKLWIRIISDCMSYTQTVSWTFGNRLFILLKFKWRKIVIIPVPIIIFWLREVRIQIAYSLKIIWRIQLCSNVDISANKIHLLCNLCICWNEFKAKLKLLKGIKYFSHCWW